MLVDHAVDFAVSREHELEPEPKAMQGWTAGAEHAHPHRSRAQSTHLAVVLGRLQRDVVAEPFRLLMRIRVARDVDEERGVVHGPAHLLVETEPFGDTQRDQALAEHVLHRLAKAEIDAERKRRDQLCQADLGTIRIAGHRRSLVLLEWRCASAD